MEYGNVIALDGMVKKQLFQESVEASEDALIVQNDKPEESVVERQGTEGKVE